MTVHSRIEAVEPADINLTAIMERENIDRIGRYPLGRFSVVLMDGRIGVGCSVGEALERAKQ